MNDLQLLMHARVFFVQLLALEAVKLESMYIIYVYCSLLDIFHRDGCYW